MLLWISNNIGTIIISVALAGVVAIIIFVMRKDRKKGKSSCGCSCSCCSMAGVCHAVDEKNYSRQNK